MANMKYNFIKVLAVIFCLTIYVTFSQDKIVNEYIQQYSQGKMNEVRSALPDLIVEYPNDPGVKLLLAIVLEDADKAIEIYKEIIQKYPESQWADDAYWRLLEYYAVKGDVDKAEYELENFRKRYPTSEYLTPATDVVRTAQSIVAMKLKKEKASAEQQQQATTKDVASNEPKKEQTEEVKSTSKTYGLQVGIYTTQEAAETEKERFLKQRLRTTIEEKVVDGVTKYAVVIGNYSSMESAEAAKQIIQQQCNCKPLIYQK